MITSFKIKVLKITEKIKTGGVKQVAAEPTFDAY